MFDAAVNNHWTIEFMKEYDVAGEHIDPVHGKYYILAHDPNYGYAEEHFVPMPDDDEIEEARQEAEADEYDRQFAQILESNPDAI